MIKALIIEDETAAARNLKVLLASSHPEIDIIATLESVSESVEWFRTNAEPDLVFMDINLADGNAFRIFDHIRIEAPIVFTTAYDEYALEAFKVNSIDYILKPIKPEELERAVAKYTLLSKLKLNWQKKALMFALFLCHVWNCLKSSLKSIKKH